MLREAVTSIFGAKSPTSVDRDEFISYEKLNLLRRKKGEKYRQAEPFPHIIIDDFLEPGVAEAIVKEFGEVDESAWHRTDSSNELKMSLEDEAHFGTVTRRVLHSLNSGPFLSFLEKLTKVGGVIADSHFRGGGLHRIERGGKLGVHADYNYYRRLGVYRRLNLLIYLNEGWKKEWGGHLELWDRDKTGCVRRVLPAFNRAVIFDTSNRSYHGHPEALNCPAGMARRSLALYYYSVDYPYKDDLEPHTTVFIDGQAESTSAETPPDTEATAPDPASN